MGGGSSQIQSAIQETKNNMLQSANATCIMGSTVEISNIDIDIQNSTINGIDITAKNIMFGSSCMITNSLSADIINKQKTKQKSVNSQDVQGLFHALGATDSQSQSSYQSLVNNVSQFLSASCKNVQMTRESDIKIKYDHVIDTGGIHIGIDSSNKNSKCNLNNIAKASVSNDQSAEQTEKMEGTISLIMHAIIVICIVAVIFLGIMGIFGIKTSSKVMDKAGKVLSSKKQPGAKPGAVPGAKPGAKPGAVPGAKPAVNNNNNAKPAFTSSYTKNLKNKIAMSAMRLF